MELRRLQLEHFRNYTSLDIALGPGLHVFAGSNAQGKTNLLEAVYLSATGNSPRTNQEGEMIAWDADIARVIAESGMPTFEMTTIPNKMLFSLGLPTLLPFQAIIALLWIHETVTFDTRENAAGFAAQASGVAERRGLRPGMLLLWLGILAIVAAVLAVCSVIMCQWVVEAGGGRKLGDGFNVTQLTAMADAAASDPAKAMSDMWGGLLAGPVMVGVLLVAAITVLRRFWVGFPFHPIGLVLAFTSLTWSVWGSLLLGWLAKVAVLRYGGTGLYARLKPVALGLIVGDLLGMFVQFVVCFGGGTWSRIRDLGWDLPFWR